MTRPPSSLLHYLLLLTFYSLLLSSCSPATPTAAPEPITVQYSAAAQPWLSAVYDCAGKTPIFANQRAVQYFDPSADIAIRLGEPEQLRTPAFEIGIEEILVIVHPQNHVTEIGVTEVRELFTGRIRNWSQLGGPDASVRVWIYAPGEDIQRIFEAAVMQGGTVTSLAQLATSPDEMYQAIADDVNAIGILPRSWKVENVQEVYVAATVPVLAIIPSEEQGVTADLLACLQK
jgi:hypothetical protein